MDQINGFDNAHRSCIQAAVTNTCALLQLILRNKGPTALPHIVLTSLAPMHAIELSLSTSMMSVACRLQFTRCFEVGQPIRLGLQGVYSAAYNSPRLRV